MKERKSPTSESATAIEDGLILMAVAPACCKEEFWSSGSSVGWSSSNSTI
jgi:hypothetical protein